MPFDSPDFRLRHCLDEGGTVQGGNRLKLNAYEGYLERDAGPVGVTTDWDFQFATNTAYAYLSAGNRLVSLFGASGYSMFLDALAIERLPLFRDSGAGTLSNGAVSQPNGNALGGHYVSFGPTGLAKYTVTVPTTGLYSIGLGSWATSTTLDNIRVSFNQGSSWTTLAAVPVTTQWWWTRMSNQFSLTAGTVNVWFQTNATGLNGFNLDAFFLEKL